MFEKIKGIKKGTSLAEQTSKATMNVVNHLISNGHDVKTHDTLAISMYFYCYSSLIAMPTNLSSNKFINYTGAMNVQAKDLLEEWLISATGVFSHSEFIQKLDDNFSVFSREIKEEFSISDGSDAINRAKSFASEKVLKELQSHFENDSRVFLDCIGKQLESIRIAL